MAKTSPRSTFNYGDEEIDDSPIEEVRLIVPTTDDPTLPVLTFRTWFIGLVSCAILAFVNQFFSYRQNQLVLSSTMVQIVALPLGKLMGATLPSRPFKVPFTSRSFSMNPGPFNLKEHALITIFANSGYTGSYAVHIINSVVAFYHRSIHPGAAFLLCMTTEMLGYGWAGLFRKYLVESPYMWWPANLVQVSLFRALHEKEKRAKKGLTRLQFFLIVLVSSFVYYIIPGYLFPSISVISVACLIWKDSVTAQQIGSGSHGLGLGAFTLDWNMIAYFGSPLSYPASTILNFLVGFILVVYVALPIMYYKDVHRARSFPLISSDTFDSRGQIYNISRVLHQDTFDFNEDAYDGYSKLYLSVLFALTGIGLPLAALTSTISHVALFNGKDIWNMWRKAGDGLKNQFQDVHTRIMKQNYDEVPQLWFYIVLLSSFPLSVWACEGFKGQLQLPWWCLLLACGISFFFTLPVGIITATTNAFQSLQLISQLVIGYLYPGKPLANMAFMTYAYISMYQAITFISDLKLGHYMKIPPKSMYIAQLVGTVVATAVTFGTAWWLIFTIDHICDPSLLPEGSPWTCIVENAFYNQSVIWGVVGPMRIFSKFGNYPEINWFLLIGFLIPFVVWGLIKMFPEKKWLTHINVPVLIVLMT